MGQTFHDATQHGLAHLTPESVDRIRTVLDDRSEIFFYESSINRDGLMSGEEFGYVVVREGEVVLKLELVSE